MKNNKAEERALEAYPQVWNEEEDCDVNYDGRCGFIEGYEAAQKDLGWISVRNDLPKKKDAYLTFSEERGLCLTDWIDGEWRDEFDDKVSVDLWMIIPEFPKEK